MFRFTDDCVLGVEIIDDEHRHLFDLINRGQEMLENDYKGDQYTEIKELLDELEEYADMHFTNEEKYMEKICDPELILQRPQHMYFREKILEYQVQNIDYNEDQRRVLQELMDFLAKWLYQHIISSDIMIGKMPPLEEWMVKKNPCEFTEEYMTGVDLLDREHKILFEIAERANNLVKDWQEGDSLDPFFEILAELKRYTENHFADEEEFMESFQYEELPAQKKAHEAFIVALERTNREDFEEDPKKYMHSLIVFLLGWLINHILHSDVKIAEKYFAITEEMEQE